MAGYIGSKTVSLSTTAANVDGNITVTGNVDGRDVSVDGTKLDTIPVISTSSVPSFTAKSDGTTDGYIQLNCSANSHGIKFKSPPHSAGASYTLVFPTTAGNSGQFLKTDGSGNLSWGTDATLDNTKLPLAGGAMTGAITTNSTFDGRNVSSDGTKLDGIETAATADQTDAQIKTAVQNSSDIALAGNPTTTTQSASNNSTRVATTAYTDAAITALVNSAPATLDTLNELAAALGDDPNYAATTTTLIGTKMPKAGGAFTGAVTTNSTFDGVDIATRDAVLTTTTNTANAALPKAGGTVTGDLTTAADASITIQGTHNEGGGLLDLKGTDTPASGKNLGQVSFGNSTDPRLAMIRGVSTAADAADMAFFTEATGASIERRMTILSTGKVGIGVSDPDSTLDISGGSNKLGILRVTQRASGASAYGLDVGLDPSTGDPVFSRIVNDTVTEAFRIQRSSGNLSSQDITITSGTNGTNTSGLVIKNTDNNDAQGYIKKTSYYMHYNANQNEGHRFSVSGTNDLMRMHGNSNGTRPDSIDILAGNGLYMNNTQVMTLGRSLVNIATLDVGSVQASGRYLTASGSVTSGYQFSGDGDTGMFQPSVNHIGFSTGNAERMRIDSSGNLVVGTTSASAKITSRAIGGTAFSASINASGSGMQVTSEGLSNTMTALTFRTNSGPVGSITCGSSTSFNTSSDYRLKTDAQPMTGATARLKQLNPVNFEWIADGTRVDGFLAHETQAVVPECVTGTKDEVDGDGVAVMQGIDQSKLVPLLVKTIQELEARITALEA